MATLELGQQRSQEQKLDYKPLSPMHLAWRRFKRNGMGVLGAIIVGVFIFAAAFAPVIAPYAYDKTNLTNVFQEPGKSPGHLLGTDELGRDLFSRLIWGARTSLIVSVATQVFVLVIALVLGFASAWIGGAADFVVNRLLEIVGSLPGLLFQILLMTLLGNGVPQVTFVIAILAWPGFVRLVRAQVLAFKERDFVTASQSLGANIAFIAWRHIFPNIINPLIVAISFGIPGYIAAEAGLSFLGYGINDPLPSWGKMVGAAGQYLQRYTYLALLPSLCLAILVLGFSFFGDAIRDALDPSSDRVS